MDEPRDYHSKSSQKKKDKYHVIFMYGVKNMTQGLPWRSNGYNGMLLLP